MMSSRKVFEDALRLIPAERERVNGEIDAAELILIEAAMDQGATITSLAVLWGITRQGAQQRYRKLGGVRVLPAGRHERT